MIKDEGYKNIQKIKKNIENSKMHLKVLHFNLHHLALIALQL